ncbi:hypothetical protein OGAPHI_002205 [Ogataea philodendri]|uniref:Amino acid transporter transmembrane domain-containing protein n=1 Tax=Ogataea philodendri TaxID=1378263 RepID=A0A9P8T7Y7_9ASCO|nr:uncharacterized protein OGAPHI_002205 [Ogataea philodendri]KAH3668451.1 hypothetical protein OGAPHI_002205 [Ogataea philodendri]
MLKPSVFGDISPKVSRALDEEVKDQALISDEPKSSDYELKEQPLSRDDRHSRGLPLKLYRHYADIQRSYEQADDFDGLYAVQREQMRTDARANISEEKLDSQRKLRQAKVYSVFFLITTDILGPSNAPYAIAQMGYVPGIILYVVFGIMAALGGYLLNYCFCKLDSNNYPIRTFSDLAGRAVGAWFRYPTALLQFVQMIMNVGLILLSTAQSLAQLLVTNRGHNGLCYTVEIVVWSFLGMILGQIKTLSRFAHIANSAVWMNVAVCIITMVAVGIENKPNYDLFWSNYGCTAPYDTLSIHKYAIAPGSLSDRIDGMNNMVFAWGGATVFCEVMYELKKPMDFWKGMLCAQAFIMVIYLVFGLFVYSYLGQWSYVTANMGIATRALQTATNVINLVSGMLAAVLYANVGLKVAYQGFLVSDFGFPQITTKKGTIFWGVLVIIYWAVAFIIGAAIPGISQLVSIIGAFCIFQFSYTLPFLFILCLLIRLDATEPDTFDPTTETLVKADSFASWSRWKRALTHGGYLRTSIKLCAFLLFLAALSCAGLCSYSAIEAAIAFYKNSSASAFGCTAPVSPNSGFTCAGITVGASP